MINGSVDYSIIDGLKIGVLASADLNKINGSGFIPAFPIDRNASLSGTSDEDAHTYNADAHISYDKTLGKNTVNLLAAYEYNSYAFNSDYANTSAGSTSSGTFKEDYKLKSFIARAAYSYDERLYIAAALRKDNSTLAAPAYQPGAYPSVSLAYRFKKDLLTNVEWISDIKLKAGYGVSGNSLAFNGIPSSIWEQTHGTNIGLDFSLLNGWISGDVNYFNDQSKNLIVDFGSNLNAPTIGSLTNTGLEIALSGRIISGRKLNWTAYGQITFISTALSSQFDYLIIPQGEAQGRGLSSSPITFLKTGYSPYVFYLPHYTGTDAQGNQTFDGKTIQQNPNPQGYYVDPAPKFNYGITNSFDYGNWNLSFVLRGVYGQKNFNNTLLNIETVTRLPQNNVTKEALTNGIKDATVASDLWLQNASFLRLDNAALGYSFKNVSFAKVLRVFV
ncbi:MAG: hypothetical protein JSU01_18010, partial [Bacteroidetes bacterium]|nr:hypothetical protein [Bacteroidota bacterium]